MRECMLTTLDNPYDPFTEYDMWLTFDEQQGYYTNQYLARVSYTAEDLTDEEEAQAIEDAIDEIMEFNVLGIYKKVVRIQ